MTVHPCEERLKIALKAELDLALEENSLGEQCLIAWLKDAKANVVGLARSQKLYRS